MLFLYSEHILENLSYEIIEVFRIIIFCELVECAKDFLGTKYFV